MPLPPEILRFNRPLKSVEPSSDPIPASAEKRIQQRMRNSFEAGRADGEKVLNAQLIQQRTDVSELQNGLLGSIREVIPQLVKECERHLVELALEVARKVVAGMPVDQPVIEASIQEAVGQLEHACSYTVVLNPADLELLQRMKADVLVSHPDGNGHHVSFRTSQEVSPGGCLLESPFGIIDARRETRFSQVQKALLN